CVSSRANNFPKQNSTQCAARDPTRNSAPPMIWQVFWKFRAGRWWAVRRLVRTSSRLQQNTIEGLSTVGGKSRERLSISGAERWMAQTSSFVRFWVELCARQKQTPTDNLQ